MEKFQNKYRVSSFRLKNWNYCSEGDYFITICTQNMEHYFGKIENAKMQLSPVGVIADILWYQIPYHSKNVELGAFVVMPNHIHGILTIVKNNNKNCLDNPNIPTQPTIPLSSALPISSMSYSKKMNGWQKFRRRKILFRALFVPTNLPLPNMQIVWDLIFNGKPVFTTISFVTTNHSKTFPNIFTITPPIGKMIIF